VESQACLIKPVGSVSLVSVPLRGLSSWKVLKAGANAFPVVGFSPLAGIKFVESHKVTPCKTFRPFSSFSPLAGIKFVESRGWWDGRKSLWGFSPLAGIKFVESSESAKNLIEWNYVSVPLRGLSSWKGKLPQDGALSVVCDVSVPLRGLSSWKAQSSRLVLIQEGSFSPLAGIKFVERDETH
jgi:hypothetical protein